MAGMDEKLPVPEEVVGELKKANTLRGSRGRGTGGSVGHVGLGVYEPCTLCARPLP